MHGLTSRRLAMGWIGLFAISTAFPVIASLWSESSRPALLGPADVVVAAATVLLGFSILTKAQHAIGEADLARSYRIIRAGGSALLVLVAVFLVAPSAVDWVVLTVGLAWRAWLLLTVLPGVVAHLRAR
jgi:hypothetical protein